MKYFHRFFFYFLMILSVIWACFALNANPIELLFNFEFFESVKLLYILGLTAMFWPIFYIEVADFLFSVSGHNGGLYKRYAKSVQKDIVVSATGALVLGSIYWLDVVPYSFSGIDLGFIGFPFLIYAIYTIVQLMGINVAGKPVRKAPIIVMLVSVSFFALLAYLLLVKNSSGDFEVHQSIWFQLTILFASFFLFTNANLQFFFLKNGKIELSEFKKHFFSEVVKSKHQTYCGMEESLIQLNRRTSRAKANHTAHVRRKGKKK